MPGKQGGRCRRTSDLLFERGDEEDGLLENAELRLRLVRLQSHRHHPTELFERLVYVAHAYPVHCDNTRAVRFDVSVLRASISTTKVPSLFSVFHILI